jgi:hypothetical protein
MANLPYVCWDHLQPLQALQLKYSIKIGERDGSAEEVLKEIPSFTFYTNPCVLGTFTRSFV